MLTLEAQTIARACGKSHVHNLEPEDLVALTVEAAAMARVPLAGTELDTGAADFEHASVETQLGREVDKRTGAASWRSTRASREGERASSTS